MFIKPEETIKHFDLKPGLVVADLGSGSGHYVLAIAKEMNNSGIVYAVDIQKNLLEAVKSNAEKEHLSNVEIIWADIEGKEGTKLASRTLDLVVASNILFQVEDKESVAKESFRILKNGGRAAVIDWSRNGLVMGPSEKKIVPLIEVERMFLQEGFITGKEFPAGDNHYGIIFKKP